jgi:hypothetical protein
VRPIKFDSAGLLPARTFNERLIRIIISSRSRAGKEKKPVDAPSFEECVSVCRLYLELLLSVSLSLAANGHKIIIILRAIGELGTYAHFHICAVGAEESASYVLLADATHKTLAQIEK